MDFGFLGVEVIMLLAPVILAIYGLVAFCIVKICKEGVATLSKPAWITIVAVLNLFGSISFLLLGRRRDV